MDSSAGTDPSTGTFTVAEASGSFSLQVRIRYRPAGTPVSEKSPVERMTSNQGDGATKMIAFIDSWIEQ
jgi:hypothetical protein